MQNNQTTDQGKPEAGLTDNNAAAFRGTATYCPEDNKLRLYVGRVPREDYLKLTADGWKALHKQREAGGGDFVATWTPARRALCLEWCGSIEDEDMSPQERAADRAERFAGYREKRVEDATGHADRYDAQPLAHGFQSEAKAEKAAARHDRIADRAGDAWDKAEYWQQRTAGVIAHALHVSSPDVRMGRIKTLESELRGLLARWNCPAEEITQQSAKDWITHYNLRLAYENQMLEAQGGRAGVVEMVPGGTFRGGVIAKVNKSKLTGRVVSVQTIGPAVSRWTYRVSNVAGTSLALYQHETERAAPDRYQPPTDESRAELEKFEQAKKDAAKRHKAEHGTCPLINPTDADAEKMQAMLNASPVFRDDQPSAVIRMTQEQFSARMGGSCGMMVICETGLPHRTRYGQAITRSDVFKLRVYSADYRHTKRVVILTDKPQKPFPWAAVEAARAKHPTADQLRERMAELVPVVGTGYQPNITPLMKDAQYVGWIDVQSLSQIFWTDAGRVELERFRAREAVTA